MKNKIEHLKERIRKATGQDPLFGTNPNCPVEVEESFLESVLAFETFPKCQLFSLLVDLGVELPPPEKLTDAELTAKLWEVIHSLLAQSIVLCNTDHLSDRQLYALLWNKTLREEFVISPKSTLHIDMTEIGVRDRMRTYLKYYASEMQRRMYAKVHPDFKMPEHVEPPCRRDHLIGETPFRGQ